MWNKEPTSVHRLTTIISSRGWFRAPGIHELIMKLKRILSNFRREHDKYSRLSKGGTLTSTSCVENQRFPKVSKDEYSQADDLSV